MVSLLDVNVLIALLDMDHVDHLKARTWFVNNVSAGWATCSLTQNGCVRIMSQPGYLNALPLLDVMERLAIATRAAEHQFWADDVSILDERVVRREHIQGPRQITDLHLLALAVRNGGRLATFDRGIPLKAVHGAQAHHVEVL